MIPGIALVFSLLIAMSTGGLGSSFTAKAIPTWYAGLNKPTWNPPNWLFAPVWTVLYLLMGTAAWLVWRETGFTGQWVFAYAAQLVLNTAWSYLFFGMRRPDLAFVEIILLWLSIAITMVVFWQIEKVAGVLFVPYLLWVSFAAVLNFTIWRLNRRSFAQ